VDTPHPSPRTNRTRRVPHPVLIGRGRVAPDPSADKRAACMPHRSSPRRAGRCLELRRVLLGERARLVAPRCRSRGEPRHFRLRVAQPARPPRSLGARSPRPDRAAAPAASARSGRLSSARRGAPPLHAPRPCHATQRGMNGRARGLCRSPPNHQSASLPCTNRTRISPLPPANRTHISPLPPTNRTHISLLLPTNRTRGPSATVKRLSWGGHRCPAAAASSPAPSRSARTSSSSCSRVACARDRRASAPAWCGSGHAQGRGPAAGSVSGPGLR